MLQWNTADLDQLSPEFKAGLKSNVPWWYIKDAVVQLGRTGLGTYPNYQVTLPNGVLTTYSGTTHKRLPYSSFNRANVSHPIKVQSFV